MQSRNYRKKNNQKCQDRDIHGIIFPALDEETWNHDRKLIHAPKNSEYEKIYFDKVG